jgi:hypothetical protein
MSAFRILRMEFFHENLTEHELDASEVNLGTNIKAHSTIALEATLLACPHWRGGISVRQKIKASALETGIEWQTDTQRTFWGVAPSTTASGYEVFCKLLLFIKHLLAPSGLLENRPSFPKRCSPSAIGGLGAAALNQLLHPAQALEHPLEVWRKRWRPLPSDHPNAAFKLQG